MVAEVARLRDRQVRSLATSAPKPSAFSNSLREVAGLPNQVDDLLLLGVVLFGLVRVKVREFATEVADVSLFLVLVGIVVLDPGSLPLGLAVLGFHPLPPVGQRIDVLSAARDVLPFGGE